MMLSHSLGNVEEVMGSFIKRFDKNVNRVLSGGYASWEELEKESPFRYNEMCITKISTVVQLDAF